MPVTTHKDIRPPSPTSWQEKINRVAFGEKIVTKNTALNQPSLWQSILREAYVNDITPFCLCKPEKINLSISKAESGFILKRTPKSGHLHHVECDSHGGISPAAFANYNTEAIREKNDKVLIRLSVPLFTTAQTPDGYTLDGLATPELIQSQKLSTFSLRSLLHLLWDESGLSSWSPGMAGKRLLTRVYWRLKNQCENIILNGEDASLFLFVPSGHVDDNKATELINDRFRQLEGKVSEDAKPVLLILGEVRSIKASKRNMAVRIKGLPDDLPVWTPPQAIERFAINWDVKVSELSQGKAWKQGKKQRLFVLTAVQRTEQGNLVWRYGTFMPTTDEYIPFNTQEEAEIIKLRILNAEKFDQPLSYDYLTPRLDGDDARAPC